MRQPDKHEPAYRPTAATSAVLGGVQAFAVGPRSMVIPSPSSSPVPESWGFAGNLTATWQAFLPVGKDLDARARDWVTELLAFTGLGPRPVGTGLADSRRIGTRLKKYAILHPYVSRLRIAAAISGDGREVLDSLRVIDEPTGTPKGAQTIRDLRYELTLIGPESERFGRAVDELTLSPGDDKWRRYAGAVLDNPESLLVPGFAYAKRSVAVRDGIHGAWAQLTQELGRFGDEGLHVTLIGPMLGTSVGVAARAKWSSSFRARGLGARPVVRSVKSLGGAAFEGNWILSVEPPPEPSTTSLRSAAVLASAVDLAHGVVDPNQQVGLEVAISGSISEGLKTAHQVSDWVVITDPLFSIELLDRAHAQDAEALLLDFTPEFDPYPGGRVVVSTKYLREVDAMGSAVASALSSKGVWTSILASISARLLLSLANPTRQVVHGLAGLALSRVHVAMRDPGALVVPIDGHEDMFVLPHLGHGNILADLLVVHLDGVQLEFEVVESKWSTKANLPGQVEHGVKQAGTTAEAIRASYLDYRGVDRDLRIDNLREVLLFHLARAARHDVQSPSSAALMKRLTDPEPFKDAHVRSTVLAWSPDGSFGSGTQQQDGETTVRYFDGGAIDLHAEAAGRWPNLVDGRGAEGPADLSGAAISEIVTESIADDLQEREERETAEDMAESSAVASAVAEGGTAARARSPENAELAPKADTGETLSLGDCVRLGSLGLGRAEANWCPPRLSNGHLIIIGGSGAGKTTALRHISREIADREVPVLVIDFHGDIDVPGAKGHEFDYSGNLSFVNPFHLDAAYGAKLTPSRLKWEFLEAWKSVYPTMGVHQTNYLASLVEEAYGSAGITDDPATWRRAVTFGDVLEAFDRSEAPESQRAKIESYMKRFLEWRIFHGGNAISVESFLSGTTRLDLSQLDESARNILADVILRRLFLLVRAMGPLDPSAGGWVKFRIYVVIDEAQILMGSSSDAKASLTKYAAEARKFGVGLILATQLRDNVPSEIWGNIDTRLFMQALDPSERARNARAANVPEAMLRSLSRGEAILMSSSQPNAAPVTLRIEPSWLRAST